jgi:hypothetical protein
LIIQNFRRGGLEAGAFGFGGKRAQTSDVGALRLAFFSAVWRWLPKSLKN